MEMSLMEVSKSGFFYLFLAIAVIVLVVAYKMLANTTVGRTLGGISEFVENKLTDADPSSREHSLLNQINNQIAKRNNANR